MVVFCTFYFFSEVYQTLVLFYVSTPISIVIFNLSSVQTLTKTLFLHMVKEPILYIPIANLVNTIPWGVEHPVTLKKHRILIWLLKPRSNSAAWKFGNCSLTSNLKHRGRLCMVSHICLYPKLITESKLVYAILLVL